jgi:hypothetical protein
LSFYGCEYLPVSTKKKLLMTVKYSKTIETVLKQKIGMTAGQMG